MNRDVPARRVSHLGPRLKLHASEWRNCSISCRATQYTESLLTVATISSRCLWPVAAEADGKRSSARFGRVAKPPPRRRPGRPPLRPENPSHNHRTVPGLEKCGLEANPVRRPRLRCTHARPQRRAARDTTTRLLRSPGRPQPAQFLGIGGANVSGTTLCGGRERKGGVGHFRKPVQAQRITGPFVGAPSPAPVTRPGASDVSEYPRSTRDPRRPRRRPPFRLRPSGARKARCLPAGHSRASCRHR